MSKIRNELCGVLFLISSVIFSSCYGGLAAAPYLAQAAGGLIAGSIVGEAAGKASVGKPSEAYTGASVNEHLGQELIAVQNDDLEIRIHAVIKPDGPGSWMKGAAWNEIVFTVKNLSGHEITVDKISAIDSRGVYVDQIGERELLTFQQNRLQDASNAAQQNFSVPKMTAEAFGTTLLDIFGLPVTGAYFMGKSLAASENSQKIVAENQKIMKEFQQRQLNSLVLAEMGSVTGSAFFALESGAMRQLVFSLERRGAEKRIRIDLPSDY